MKISKDTTIGDLIQSGEYKEFADYFFTYMTPDHFYNKLENYGYETCGFEEALPRIRQLAESGENYVYNVYEKEDCLANWDKAKVKLLYFPGTNPSLPYVLVIPGGGLNRQWGLIEGQAVAAHLNKLGYTAFVLYYRTKQEPVMDKALEDMYAAIRFIDKNAASFNVEAGNYIIGGFSAGAILAQETGTSNLGYRKFGVAKPKMIFLGYTAILFTEMYRAYCACKDTDPVKAQMAVFLKKLGGPEITGSEIAQYNIEDYIDEDYPKTYLVCNEDDTTVGVASTKHLDAALQAHGILHKTRIGEKGGHSFGLGRGLEVEGWLEEALDFAAKE